MKRRVLKITIYRGTLIEEATRNQEVIILTLTIRRTGRDTMQE